MKIFLFAVTILITQQILLLRIGVVMLSYFIGLKIEVINFAADTDINELRDFFDLINGHQNSDLTSCMQVYHVNLLSGPYDGPNCPQRKKRTKGTRHFGDSHPDLLQHFDGLDIINKFLKSYCALLIPCGDCMDCNHPFQFFLARKRYHNRFIPKFLYLPVPTNRNISRQLRAD
jgi:hypothetical protein